ncbi:MAG: hypothetical protein A3K67_05655 [Euryarchaeota archaeon RBG_16_62_10]|nr:MAG: hypothetical protein A3K67_05655 [Euryarchaeota archaeon RBG_16_62_10]
MTGDILVVGGDGFIGRAIQDYALNYGLKDAFTFVYRDSPAAVLEGLRGVRTEELLRDGAKELGKARSAIFIVGNPCMDLADEDPTKDLEQDLWMLTGLVKHIRGSLVMLSSQAVYYGLEGEIPENANHVPMMPYGLSKQTVEGYAKYFLETKALRRLWIFRLLYAYGKGEPDTRLIPRCAKAAATGEKVVVKGTASYLNPLPASFVAEALAHAANSIMMKDAGRLEVTNLSSPQRVLASDVVTVLAATKRFEFKVDDKGERWPVRYYGATANLTEHMKDWRLAFPDARSSVREHFLNMVREGGK